LYDIIILGGGASALFLNDFLKNKKVLIIEHNPDIGAKIKISGGGRCNITNRYVSYKNYYPQSEFVKNALSIASNDLLFKWLHQKKLKIYELKNNQFFLGSSKEIINVLRPQCDILYNCEILNVKLTRNFEVFTNKGVFEAKNVVVALGGKSYKKLGASEKGYEIAKKFGHTVTALKPALVGLTVQPEQSWFKKLSGISINVDVYIGNKFFSQNILFSHRGITGPAILNASLYWERGKIKIDFLKGKKVKDFLKNRNKQIVSQLPFPKNFTREFLKSEGIADKKVFTLSENEWQKLFKLENYEFAPAGTFGFERAEVTKGGVLTDEISKYMESKIYNGLYFIGEVLDVTGELGGYNFQWAFSSAYCAYLGLSL